MSVPIVTVVEPTARVVVDTTNNPRVVMSSPGRLIIQTQPIAVGGGGGTMFRENETPSGTLDGVNAVFTLAHTPSPTNSLLLFRNGLLMHAGSGNDFTLSGSTITFEAAQIPVSGDVLLATYQSV